MSFYKTFPRFAALCCALSVLSIAAQAQQQTAARPRTAEGSQPTTTTTQPNGRAKLESDIVAAQPAQEDDDDYAPGEAVEGYVVPTNLGHVEQEILVAIEERLGTPYRMGATGPNRYDCSGFVWSVFQEAGITFERSTARTLWQEYAPASEGDKFKFGTLVFFRNVHHVGIVADANGFFHASSHGVVYSHFNDYWTKRISGFRRIPLSQGPALVASIGR